MKRIYTLSLFFVSASSSLTAMEFFKEKLKNVLHSIKMKCNEGYRIEQTIANNMRAIPFMFLKEKYMDLDAAEISKEDINELNNLLLKKNKVSQKARIEDLNNCLINYNDIYLKQRNESNNKNFLDIIIPTLFVGQDFAKTENYSLNSHTMTPDSLLICSRQNPYLMSCLLYMGKVSFKTNSENSEPNHSLLSILGAHKGSGFIFNGSFDPGDNDESHINYIKAIFTPPALLIKNVKKDALISIKAFLYCLNRLKKKSFSYKIPKPVMNNLILYFIIKNTIPKEATEQCNTVRHDAYKQIENIKILTIPCNNKNHPNCMYNFLSQDFEQWAEKNMNIAWLALQDMVFNKK